MSPEEHRILLSIFADTETQIRAMFRLSRHLSNAQTPIATMKRQIHENTLSELLVEQSDTVQLLSVDPRLAAPDLCGPH